MRIIFTEKEMRILTPVIIKLGIGKYFSKNEINVKESVTTSNNLGGIGKHFGKSINIKSMIALIPKNLNITEKKLIQLGVSEVLETSKVVPILPNIIEEDKRAEMPDLSSMYKVK